VTPSGRDYFSEIYNARLDVHLFLDTMLAAANRDDETAVRLGIIEAFENDHDIRPLVTPYVSALDHELWATYTIDPGTQARIYL